MNIALFGRVADIRHKDGLSLLFRLLMEKGARLFIYSEFYSRLKELFGCSGCVLPEDSGISLFHSREEIEGMDLFLSLGGDGTILDSLHFVAGSDVPVAGINFGRLGFLATATVIPEGDNAWLDRLLSGDYDVDRRHLLDISAPSLPAGFDRFALNEITVQRTSASMLNIELELNGEKLPGYWSDGLLVSTPTGSTAYSLSIGGPVVMPSSKVLIVAPIAPHNLNVRPLIVPDNSRFVMTVHSRSSKALVSVDNRSFEVFSGEKIEVSLSDLAINYVCLRPGGFIEALTEKLMWGEDRRNSSI